jgi:hypothetical protein
LNISLDDPISTQTPDPTPMPGSGFANVPTPVPTPVPAPIPDPPYEVNLSEAARSAPTKLGAKLSLELL